LNFIKSTQHNIFFLSNQQQVNVLIGILIQFNFIELNQIYFNWIFFHNLIEFNQIMKCISAMRYFVLLVMMNCFFLKDIYVILVHILGRERCIYWLWNFVNVFAFVSKHIEIFRDQIQTQCMLHMLLWKHHMMSCLFVVLHLHMCIASCSRL
jgi:hypothetical protein